MGNKSGGNNAKPHTVYPLYAKVGWVVSWVVMLTILILIFRNCAGSIFYGTQTTEDEIQVHFQQGYHHGLKKEKIDKSGYLTLENPLLEKAYRDGYRHGLIAAEERVLAKEE